MKQFFWLLSRIDTVMVVWRLSIYPGSVVEEYFRCYFEQYSRHELATEYFVGWCKVYCSYEYSIPKIFILTRFWNKLFKLYLSPSSQPLWISQYGCQMSIRRHSVHTWLVSQVSQYFRNHLFVHHLKHYQVVSPTLTLEVD